MPLTGKTMSSNRLYAHMLRTSEPVKIKKYRTEDYSGFKIRIHPELVEGSGSLCEIYKVIPAKPDQLKGITYTCLGSRRGLQEAKQFIDSYLQGLERRLFTYTPKSYCEICGKRMARDNMAWGPGWYMCWPCYEDNVETTGKEKDNGSNAKTSKPRKFPVRRSKH